MQITPERRQSGNTKTGIVMVSDVRDCSMKGDGLAVGARTARYGKPCFTMMKHARLGVGRGRASGKSPEAG